MITKNAPAATPLTRLRDDILDWCRGWLWQVRVPLWALMIYIGAKQFWEPMYAFNCLFAGINTGIHEGGHLLFRSFGEFLCVAGGTILQLAAPLGAIYGFLKQRDYFAICVGFGWLSTNIMATGVYMADAEAMDLPLVTVGGSNGGEVTHDWRYLFTKLGLLNWCEQIGWLTRQTANLSMLACIAGCAWLMWQMFKQRVAHPSRRMGG